MTDAEPANIDEERYWGDVLKAYDNGVQLDLRAKLAVEFLKSPMCQYASGDNARDLVEYALDLGTEFVAQAYSRGLLRDLPEDDGLSAPLRKHVRRNARAQALMNHAGQEMMQEEASRVAPAGGQVLNGLGPRRQ
jgi:hypothetical protein